MNNRTLVKRIAYLSGANNVMGWLLRNKLFVFGFHRIAKKRNDEFNDAAGHLTTDLAVFCERMRWLHRNGHSFVSLSDIVSGAAAVKHKPTLIYFDDGYRNDPATYSLMQQMGIQAIFFITTGFIDGTHAPWSIAYRTHLADLGLSRDAIEIALTELKSISDKERSEKLAPFFTQHSDIQNRIQSLYFNWEEILHLRSEHHAIGSHGVTHERLSELSPTELMHELTLSKQRILHHTGEAPIALSFPHGRWNSKTIEIAHRNGYSVLLSLGHGVNKLSPGEHRITLKNVPMTPSDALSAFASNTYTRNLLNLL